jgi:hypothetical protein
LGVGAVDDPSTLWAADRQGNFGNGSCCDWILDTPYLTNDWYDAEFSYEAGAPGRIELVAVGPAGRTHDHSTNACGSLPPALPPDVQFDHADSGSNPSVELDWI